MARSSIRDRVKRSTVPQIIERRQEALREMNARLRKKIAEIEKMSSSSREATIRFYYELGKEILDVQLNPQGVYGEHPLKQLEVVFETTIRTLRKAAAFRREYTPAEVDEIIALCNVEAGFFLNYQHIVYLLAFPTEKQRMKFAKRAIANLWDPKQLMRAIQRDQGKSKYAGSGAPHKLPKGISKQIQQMLDMSRAWHLKYALIWNGTGEDDSNVFANIMAAPEETLCADDFDNLLALRDILPELSSQAKEMKRLVMKSITRVEKILSARKAENMVDETLSTPAARQPRAIDIGDGGDGNDQAAAEPAPSEAPKRRRRRAAPAGAS